jgi:hypothetical protein
LLCRGLLPLRVRNIERNPCRFALPYPPPSPRCTGLRPLWGSVKDRELDTELVCGGQRNRQRVGATGRKKCSLQTVRNCRHKAPVIQGSPSWVCAQEKKDLYGTDAHCFVTRCRDEARVIQGSADLRVLTLKRIFMALDAITLRSGGFLVHPAFC